ncbi:MAG: VIT and VWA domain-containing protein [Verrucomicrobiota bacterium]
MKIKHALLAALASFASLLPLASTSHAAGTLTPVGAAQAPIQIRTHQVNVTLNNGFAQTEVLQTFFNSNAADLEAVYAFPVPKSASLSEVTIVTGEKTLNGEVLPKAEAEKAYAEEKKSGNDAGLATKNSFLTYEFKVAPVRANSEVKLRFVYYQPIEIDAGIGRYLYPLEEGGTDDVAKSFWTTNTAVEGALSINVELKSAWPVADVRVPGFETAAATQKLADGHYKLTLDRPGAKLDRDFVFYYRLAENLPGRIEVIPYRAAKDKPGTFMMVVTPGVDLKPLTRGADYTYVLDVSGSMHGKIHTLANGVSQALGQMSPTDRFRIITFNDGAREILPWTPATPENAQNAISTVKGLNPGGGTNLYNGIALGLKSLDADRASSVVLVTDGVANQGLVNPVDFHKLLKQVDVRFFSFLMGNSANWPLMRTIADATGGFYAGVSNDDDIVGQLMLAKGKITHEALHNAEFKFSGGVRVFDTTGNTPQKIYRGQQLVLFGRYEGAGKTTVTLKASLTGEDKTYTTTLDLPEIDTANPEIERLWAMSLIEQVELNEAAGFLPATEARDAIQMLGVNYQLVTDHTAMIVLDDASHARRGIARNNQQRTATERTAQSARAAQPARQARVDTAQPAFPTNAPHVSRPSRSSGGGGGGGDISGDTVFLIFMGALIAVGMWFGRCRKEKSEKREVSVARGEAGAKPRAILRSAKRRVTDPSYFTSIDRSLLAPIESLAANALPPALRLARCRHPRHRRASCARRERLAPVRAGRGGGR